MWRTNQEYSKRLFGLIFYLSAVDFAPLNGDIWTFKGLQKEKGEKNATSSEEKENFISAFNLFGAGCLDSFGMERRGCLAFSDKNPTLSSKLMAYKNFSI